MLGIGCAGGLWYARGRTDGDETGGPGIDETDEPADSPPPQSDTDPSADSQALSAVNDAVNTGDEHRETARTHRDAGEYNRALTAYENAHAAYEDALDTATEHTFIDTEPIEAKLAEIDDEKRKTRRQRVQNDIDSLRDNGSPTDVPEAGSEALDSETYEQTPLWGLSEAAVALDVCYREDFVEHETKDGKTYFGFDASTYNAVLRALDDHGVDHGREQVDVETGSEYSDTDLAAFVDGDGDPWVDPDTMLRACLRARGAGAVSESAAPPTLALLPLRRDVLNESVDRDMNADTRDKLEELFDMITVDDLDDLLDGPE